MGLFKKTKIEEAVDQMNEAQRAEAAKRAEQLTAMYDTIVRPERKKPAEYPTASDFYYGNDTSPTYRTYDFTSRPTISQSTAAAIEKMIDQKLEHLTTNAAVQTQVNKLAVEIRLVREMLDSRVSSNELVELRTLLENTIGGTEMRLQEIEEDLYGA